MGFAGAELRYIARRAARAGWLVHPFAEGRNPLSIASGTRYNQCATCENPYDLSKIRIFHRRCSAFVAGTVGAGNRVFDCQAAGRAKSRTGRAAPRGDIEAGAGYSRAAVGTAKAEAGRRAYASLHGR